MTCGQASGTGLFPSDFMDTQVMDLMSTDAVTVAPDCTLRELVTILIARGIGAVPVVADGKLLVGIVSYVDLLQTFKDVPDSALRGI